MKKKVMHLLTLGMTVGLLTACGGEYIKETGNVSGGAVSGQDVSGSAVSGQAIEEGEALALNVHVATEGKVTIPDPAKAKETVDIWLRKEPNDDEIYGDGDDEEEYSIEEDLYEGFVADLTFAGFDDPVFVSSYAVGNLTKDTDTIAHVTTQTKKGINEKEIKGDCLALFVTTGISTVADYNADDRVDISYFLVLDYGTGKCYKTKTDFFLHDIQYWVDLKTVDVTEDGVDELIVKHSYNKTICFGAYRTDLKKGKLKEIYSTLANWEKGEGEPGHNEFKGTLLNDYKVKLEFPCIGYSKTVSMIEDGGYKEKELQVENEIDRSGCINFVALWKDGILKKNEEVFLYTLDHVDFIKKKDGEVWVDFVRTIDVGHRAYSIGNMHIYFRYDESLDTLVLAGAKYVNMKQAQKEWKKFY